MKRFFFWLVSFVHKPAVCWLGLHALHKQDRIVMRLMGLTKGEDLPIVGFVERHVCCYYCKHEVTGWVQVAGPVLVDPELTEEQIGLLNNGASLIFPVEGESEWNVQS